MRVALDSDAQAARRVAHEVVEPGNLRVVRALVALTLTCPNPQPQPGPTLTWATLTWATLTCPNTNLP